MTKTQMPEPVAWLHEEGDHIITAAEKRAANASFARYEQGLITTTQAEAYADARVREALINAANKVADPAYIEATIENFAWVTNGNYARAHLILQDAVNAICALIPKENNHDNQE